MSYSNGNGVRHSDVDALRWLIIAVARAAAEGDSFTDVPDGLWKKNLDAMEKAMPAEGVAEAKKQAREWFDKFEKQVRR